MRGFAKIVIAGNLTRDPELRSTSTGRSVASFGVAVNRGRRGNDAQGKDEVTFYNCTAWGAQGENISKYLHRGDPILLSGRPALRPWTGRDGVEHSSLEVDVDDFVFLGNGNRENGSNFVDSTNGYATGFGGGAASSTISAGEEVVLEDIPAGEISMDQPFGDAPAAEAKAGSGKKSSKKSAKSDDSAAAPADASDMDMNLDEIPF